MLGRIALALLAAATLCAVIRGWDPPFPLSHGLHAAARHRGHGAPSQRPTRRPPQAAQQRARDQARYVYVQDAEPLVQLRAKLRNTLVELTTAPTLDKLDPKIWKDFQAAAGRWGEAARRQAIRQSRRSSSASFARRFTPQERLDRVEKAAGRGFCPLRAARPVG